MTSPSAGHVRLTMGGQIGPSQTWSTGIAVATGDTLTAAQLSGLLTAFRTAVTTNLWGSTTTTPLRSNNSTLVDLRAFRAYWYPFGAPPAGLQAAQDITPIAGQATSSMHPAQVCLVASLLTGLPGRSFRGRMYLPGTAYTVGNDLQVASTALQPTADALKAVIDAVNTYTTTNGPGDVVVAGSAGRTPVTSIRIDSELDIQRRRADKILAARTVSAVIA